MSWYELQGEWHEFFLLTGTAAVTLAGLLFVALSIHIDALIDERREHLLALAQGTLLSFIFVMTLSLVQLIPHESMRVTGVMLVVMGVVFFGFTLFRQRQRVVQDRHFSVALLRRRQIVPLLLYALTAYVGVRLLRGDAQALVMLVGAVIALLASAANTSWDLLVRVARMRREPAAPQPAPTDHDEADA